MQFRPVEGWGRLPEGWSYVEATSVAVDAQDNVWVFNRGEHPVIVFDREGKFLRSWGEGLDPARPRHQHRPRRHASGSPTICTTPSGSSRRRASCC